MLQPRPARFNVAKSSQEQQAEVAEQPGAGLLRGLPTAWCKHRQQEAEPARSTTAAIGFEYPGGLVVGRPSF
ncbi:hypothetical protein NDU88_002231 [Pleurodeles waltl]|uniref:Uncharacterized protein n=1 Tax=Pleurodeles waltl TaxID=8319 RepID=A0AAV7UUZ1_PLEWA|nr:hypothetical protein NDU88_002231 [Pleurodeles waltl]